MRQILRACSFDFLRQRVQKEVPALISLKREGTYWDFKREWHEDNSNLMHDILSLANNLESQISYLVIGIDETSDYEACDVSTNSAVKRRNAQGIIDMLSKASWGNGRPPFVIVEPLGYKGKTLDVLAVASRRDGMPYYLAKPCGKVRAWMVHTRRLDQNTPIDEGANWGEVQSIWRHHFALDESPVERLGYMLSDKESWRTLSRIEGTDDKYYSFAPEYVIEHRADYSRDAYEHYCLSQMDARPGWYKIFIRYHQTVIYDTLGIALDGGRYFAPVPLWSFVRWSDALWGPEANVCYCYYVKDSLEWSLNKFLYDEDSDDARISRKAFLEMVLLFEDEEEREAFERALRVNKEEFQKRVESSHRFCEGKLPKDYAEKGKEILRRRVESAYVLQKMLSEFRAGKLSCSLPI